MKVIKRPENLIFDTDTPNVLEFKFIDLRELTPLHQVVDDTVLDFLNKHFQGERMAQHPVFVNFSNSYYYTVRQ